MSEVETQEATAKANIFTAINAVMQEIGYVQKQRSPGLKYTFAGEAALIGALRPVMVEQGIFGYVEDVFDVVQRDYTTVNGALMSDVSLSARVRFVHAPSGTSILVTARGEGADNGDKATNKAATGAYKYALRQTFMIETGDDPDETHEERGANQPPVVQRPAVTPQRQTPPPAAQRPATSQPPVPEDPPMPVTVVAPDPASLPPVQKNGAGATPSAGKGAIQIPDGPEDLAWAKQFVIPTGYGLPMGGVATFEKAVTNEAGKMCIQWFAGDLSRVEPYGAFVPTTDGERAIMRAAKLMIAADPGKFTKKKASK